MSGYRIGEQQFLREKDESIDKLIERAINAIHADALNNTPVLVLNPISVE